MLADIVSRCLRRFYSSRTRFLHPLFIRPLRIVVHEKFIRHRNIVSFATILFLSAISALTFTRGMAWIQVVWNLHILENQDLLLFISFFSWLGVLAAVHALFIWHTLRTEERANAAKKSATEDGSAVAADGVANDVSQRSSPAKGGKKGDPAMRRNSSYSSFVFDPRTHFVDGKCQFSEHPDLDDDHFSIESTHAPTASELHSPPRPADLATGDCGDHEEGGSVGVCIVETPVVAADEGGSFFGLDLDGEDHRDDGFDNDPSAPNNIDENSNADEEGSINPTQTINEVSPAATKASIATKESKKRCCVRPACCKVLCVHYTPEYQQSSRMWKFLVWIKISVVVLAYMLFLYFVAVSIGATAQIASTRRHLPAVHEAIYNHMDEGPVCAFDNRGPDSNITTFQDKDAAHEAGFLIVHCGACGACSSWDNLIVEWVTRDNLAALAQVCAKKSLFGGEDSVTECLMEPSVGFGEECAICWTEDILCTKKNCAFIYLQAQMINNVGNFAVGPNEITSANCEEAHCEVGQFVPCSGATRRRMNISECFFFIDYIRFSTATRHLSCPLFHFRNRSELNLQTR